MDWLMSSEMEDDYPEFTLAEILEMERLYRVKGKESQGQEFYQEVATKFSCSAHRTGESTIKWEQVQNWFQEKQKCSAAKVTSSPVDRENFTVASEATTTTTKRAIQIISSLSLQDLVNLSKEKSATERPLKPKAERVAELAELTFEALSSKDSAWYDVAAFLNYRIVFSGELEVRVRFAGFSHDQDEWVNVKKGIRERSIPLEPSECHKVKVGDLALCYRANDDHALYSDAQVVKVERKMHDNSGCTCIFVVRFEYDNNEGQVQLSEICCRPTL